MLDVTDKIETSTHHDSDSRPVNSIKALDTYATHMSGSEYVQGLTQSLGVDQLQECPLQ